MASLAERLRQARLEKKLTLEQVAEALNTSYPTIWRYEAGQRNPPGPTLHALAMLYGRPMEWFFGEEEPPPPDFDPSTYEEDVAFIESIPDLAFRGLDGDLTPEDAKTIRDFIEFVRARRQQENNESADDQGNAAR